ncbi:MAG: SdrD B-like domain-containing protein, partial [Actinomycetes bacterium]
MVIGTTAYSGDTAIFAKVGRVGLGDVDVTSAGKTLLAVDMDETAPKLYTVPILGSGDAVTAGTPVATPIPKPATFGAVACPGKWHPMGIGVRGSRVLVGGVCGAENTLTASLPNGPSPTQATAFVLQFSGSSFSTVFATPLSYNRGCTYTEIGLCVDNASTTGSLLSADWGAWNEYPKYVNRGDGKLAGSDAQPMLSNIEIADDGDLVLAFRDRAGDMHKQNSVAWSQAYSPGDPVADPPLPYPTVLGQLFAAGDTIRACKTATSYSLEPGGTCPGLAGSATTDSSGAKEFYYDAYDFHAESTTGATASMPGYPGIWSTVYDVTTYGEQGVIAYGDCAAATTRSNCKPTASTLGYGSKIGGYGFAGIGFGKGIAMADLEIICDQAPLQIGNRVWIDTDRDGVQDPNEVPVAGVTVRLYDANGMLVGTAVTSAKGEYYFSSNVTEPADGGAAPDPAGGGLTVDARFTIRLDNPVDFATGGPLATLELTRRDAVTAVTTDMDDAIDSDATTTASGTRFGVDQFPTIDVAPHAPGSNDHTFDVGFAPQAASVGDFVWWDADRDGVQDPGEQGIAGVTLSITNADGSPVTDVF